MFALEFLRTPVWQGLTWTLLHFLWQGFAVAVVLLLVLGILGVRRPQVRYLFCMAAMGVMVICPIVTFSVLLSDADRGATSNWNTNPTGPTIPEAAGDFDPDLSPELATNHVAIIPLSNIAERAEESRFWDRMKDYIRGVQPYLLAAWVLGVACLSIRLLLGFVAVRWLRNARCAISSQLVDSVARLSSAIGLKSTRRVFVSSRIREAMVVGILRPMVLLPAAWIAEMPPEILEAVIAHELAHIRRRDLWATFFQRLVETLFFYHPAVWWISRRVSSEREKCCDELAVAATGQRVTYAKALEQAAAIRLVPTEPVCGAAFGGRKMAILDRVGHILGMSATGKTQRARWWPVGLLVLLLFAATYRIAFQTPLPILNEARAEQIEVVDAKAIAAKPATDGIRPLDLLNIEALNTWKDVPINGTYLVEIDGQVSLGPAYGRVNVKGLSAEEAEGPIEKKLAETLEKPKVSVTRAGHVTFWTKAVLPNTPYRIKPGDQVHINVLGTLIVQSINDDFLVEPSGKVSLGPAYKRVQINGMTLEEAETTITKYLRKILRQPTVAVTMAGYKMESISLPTAPYRIAPGDLLKIEALNTLIDQPINGTYLVEQSGTVCLGPAYGRVQLKGMSVQEAGVAAKKHLETILKQPEVAVTMAGWASTTSRPSRETILAKPSTSDTKTKKPDAKADSQPPIKKVETKQNSPRPDDKQSLKQHAVQRRSVKKSVKDFPDKVDLSTPESAVATYNRAVANPDPTAEMELSAWKYSSRDVAEIERTRKNHPDRIAKLIHAYPNAEVVEVLTYRNDLADVITKLNLPRDPYSARCFGKINGQWKNLGEDRLPSLEAARKNFDRKKDRLWQNYIKVRDGIKSGNPVPLRPKRSAPIAPGRPLGISVEKADLMGRVEWAMMHVKELHGGKDITARKTIEWGNVEKLQNGDRKIRYKFYATIWNKDVYVMNMMFTFDAEGNILDIDHVEGFPKRKTDKPADVNTQEGIKVLVELFFSRNYRDITAREDIEWGEVVKNKDGNSSIRYKFRATIWDKDVKIMNKVFTFDPKGKFVSVKDVHEYPREG